MMQQTATAALCPPPPQPEATPSPPQPQRTSTLNPCASEWYPPGHSPASAGGTGTTPAATVFLLSELPGEILSSVVGCLSAPQDLTACLLASQHMQSAVRSARVSFQLTGRPRQLLSFPSQAGALSDLVHALTRYMPAMLACDLSMLPLEHTHVVRLSQGLYNLQHLDLSGCKKLKRSVTPLLLQHVASKQLQSLNLQRCFQLTDACLTDLLEYACASHSSSKALQCIALSHLDLAAWPAAAKTARWASSGSGSDDDSNDNNNDGSDSSTGSSSNADSRSSSCDVPAGSNNSADGSSSSSGAVEWQRHAARMLAKLPERLGVPLLSSASALRVAVLNNCSQLSVGGLVSLAVACPQLEYVFLGGSTLATPAVSGPAGGSSGTAAAEDGIYVPPSVSAAAAAAAAAGAAAGGLAAGFTTATDSVKLPPALQQLSELLQLPATLPWEVLSACCDTAGDSFSGGSSSSSCCGQGNACSCSCSCSCSCCSTMRSRAQHHSSSAGSDTDTADQQRARKRLHMNEPSAAAVAAARAHALSLAYLAALLPGLRAIEVSFLPQGVAGWLRVCLDKLHQLRQQQGSAVLSTSSGVLNRPGSDSNSSSARPRVWQFSCMSAVADALQTLSEARRAHRAAGGGGDSSRGGSGTSPACLAMAVRCAVNSSNRGRTTPLHMAADVGCACHIRALTAAGAAAAARDASGASPLFVACESGRAAAASALLEAGADALVRNTAGETPLYIAALRGHLRVVELLLGHLSAADVDWTQRQLYGDAWTPLMAAAVANRVNVAVCLLRAASRATATTSSSNRERACPDVTRLLAAENRYGQTVLHIAARKGCRELLQLLLGYGAGRVAGRVADAAGETPLDIARRHGHETAVRELLQQC